MIVGIFQLVLAAVLENYLFTTGGYSVTCNLVTDGYSVVGTGGDKD